MIYILIYLGVFGFWMLIEFIRAPRGYENAEGFFLIQSEEKRAGKSFNGSDNSESEE